MNALNFIDKSFKIRFEISKAAFTDYERFAGTFAHNAQLCVESTDKSQFIFTFDNQWQTSLNRNGNIDLCSPVIGTGRVGEVSHLLEVLKSMNVKSRPNIPDEVVSNPATGVANGVSRIVSDGVTQPEPSVADTVYVVGTAGFTIGPEGSQV